MLIAATSILPCCERRDGAAGIGQQVIAGPPPVTPGGRYIVVRGRLWRRADPSLPDERRAELVAELMAARRAVSVAGRRQDAAAVAAARAAVDRAKTALGERGPVWWQDGTPDLNRRMAATTVYADWFARVRSEE